MSRGRAPRSKQRRPSRGVKDRVLTFYKRSEEAISELSTSDVEMKGEGADLSVCEVETIEPRAKKRV